MGPIPIKKPGYTLSSSDVEAGVQHDQTAQRFGLPTPGPTSDHDPNYPISDSWTNIRSGTNNGGTSDTLIEIILIMLYFPHMIDSYHQGSDLFAINSF